jgi:FdhD protein
MKEVDVAQYKDGIKDIKLKIAEESILHVQLNEMGYDVIISPNEIKEFVYGNLLSEGFIKKVSDVTSYKLKQKHDLINVYLNLERFNPSFLRKNYNIVWTECGSVPEIQKRKGEGIRKIKSDMTLNAKEIIGIQKKMREEISKLKRTGGVHFSGLFDSDLNLKYFAYDVGRHNAVDKVIGKAALDGEGFSDKVLFTTGRISSDIVVKCLRVRIPFVISKNSPLYTAITLARKYNLGLIGYLRGKKFDVFSGSGRIMG